MNQLLFHRQWKEDIKSHFDTHIKTFSALDTIKEWKQEQFSSFLKTECTSDKDPLWAYSPINSILRKKPTPVSSVLESSNLDPSKLKKGSQNSLLNLESPYALGFHNGILHYKHLPEGVFFSQWKDLTPSFPIWSWIKEEVFKGTGDSFYHIANAFFLEGYILYVPEDCKISHPLSINFSFDENIDKLSANTGFLNFKNLIFLDKGSKLTCVENISSKQNTLINTVTNVKSSFRSQLHWLCIDEGSSALVNMNQTYCKMDKDSQINRLGFSLGSGFSREKIDISHLEDKSQSVLLALSLLKDKSFRDQRFITRHLTEGGYSRQCARGILNNESKSIFHGRVYVSPVAYQTNCSQSAKNLLLSSQATAYTQPEMEIHCAEVKAQHGATTGPLNKDEMFYLRTRGLKEYKAFELLVAAYIQDVLNLFPEKTLINKLKDNIQKNKSAYLNI